MKLVVSILFLSKFAFSYTYLSAARDTFPSNSITINVSSNACSNAGLNSTTEVMNAAMEAVDKFWNKVPTSALELKRGSVTSFDSNGATVSDLIANGAPNTILVGCNDDDADFAGSTLGKGTLFCYSATDCRGALLLNDHPTDNPIANGTRAQLLSTVAHEIGHAFGLGHTSDSIALMYYAEDGRVQNYLTSDDIRGVSNLYPHDKELGGLLGSCGTIAFVSDDDNDDFGNFLVSFFLGVFLLGLFRFLLNKKVGPKLAPL